MSSKAILEIPGLASGIANVEFPSEVVVVPGPKGDAAGSGGFTALVDTPPAYDGQAGKLVRVKADETGLEFVDPIYSHFGGGYF